MRISDLRNKEILNFNEGLLIGQFDDLEIDLEKGLIKSLIISGKRGFLGFFHDEPDIIIPWNKIIKIGHDVIIVDLSPNNEKDFKFEGEK
ncbi:sporulation protein, YlmC/YmxH family [Anaerobranca californiensis DSM 14826]|jgi:YlmC/YmxH family sporulation protein|uniref:Sporulation protein, YlmC/YmxH family n=1 Tax=Anaerobranca californiensis DSM 14826 TaxID=1120989 RepID=A0A1M6KTD9_9FIRM|nr:YlmC/YmxH family sporulation protein [Anaerobranca californiensis]SHJ62227.1 sporulation protein, YlmC/YmxH family [Anaerobranca californiensis DSM 14826]